MSGARARRAGAALALMTASGFAGLGYQIVWTQQFAAWLGHEAAAVLAVVTAFFGGLALGALALGGRIERSAHPARWYTACELTVAAWGALLLVLLPPLSSALLRAMGPTPAPAWQWFVAFAGTFALLLPATAAMGATLPAMERLAQRPRHLDLGDDRSIAGLYAANTAGAVLGVVAAAFWLIPTFGLARSAAICVALSALCGASALAVFRAPATAVPVIGGPRDAGVSWRLALTGFLGIGYEVLVVRVLSQVSEDTVYTFALLLAVYLAGTAAGAAAYARWLARRRFVDGDRLGDRLALALALACLAGTAFLGVADRSKTLVLGALGSGVAAALGAEALLALAAFGPATVVMGALFSHLCRRASASGVTFGRALGVNTLAAAAAPPIWGVLLLPALGPKAALALVALGYLATASRRAWSRPVIAAAAAAALVVAVLAPPLRFVEVPRGGRVVSYQDGVMASVSVVADAEGVERLRIDDRQQEGSSASVRFDARQAWLPLLLHPAPRRALFLGLGTGVTASSAAEDGSIQVDAVELLPEVISASDRFAPVVAGGAARSRLHVVAADARRYVRASDRLYDVIVSDNFHPARAGSAALYTVEHFQAVQRRLAPGGLFCQWLPLHQLDLPTLRSIVRSFVSVHPRAVSILANNSLDTPVLGLVAGGDGGRFSLPALHDRLANVALPGRMRALGIEDELALLGGAIAGPAALQRFAAGAVTNTDDRPIVAYRAPWITYAPDSDPRDRLIALLGELSVDPDEVLLPAGRPGWPRRLAAYWAARDLFIRSGREVRPSPRVREMLAQVREPLLAVLRLSPDFRPAYDPLLAMAASLARTDPPEARGLLDELARLQPRRVEAPRMRVALGAADAR